jgi:hypothetical protein
MNNKDQEVLDRFHLYSQRFLQYGVAQEVYLDTLAYIKQLIEERDEARRLYCEEWAFTMELERGEAGDPRDLANEKKWDCYNTQRAKSEEAMNRIAELDEEMGL